MSAAGHHFSGYDESASRNGLRKIVAGYRSIYSVATNEPFQSDTIYRIGGWIVPRKNSYAGQKSQCSKRDAFNESFRLEAKCFTHIKKPASPFWAHMFLGAEGFCKAIGQFDSACVHHISVEANREDWLCQNT